MTLAGSRSGWLLRPVAPAEGLDVTCQDLSVLPLLEEPVSSGRSGRFYVPMHTATRIAVSVLGRVRSLNPNAHICFYGLYATVNADYLRGLGVQTLLGGEFEKDLAALARQLGSGQSGNIPENTRIGMERLQFKVPDRSDLPDLVSYARLDLGNGQTRTVGYTEASRGCKHLCRHCPIVPVYQGPFG